MISKYILHICKDTYFILQNKYFHIYDDSLEQRNLELIALFNNYKLRRYNDGSFFVFISFEQNYFTEYEFPTRLYSFSLIIQN